MSGGNRALSKSAYSHSHPYDRASNFPLGQDRAVKTAITRAVEAVEAAEKMFADEMGATPDLNPAAKTALIATITAAIQAAVAEERQYPAARSAGTC